MKPSVFRVVVVVLASATVFAATGFAAAPVRAVASPSPVSAKATHPPYPASLTVESELRLKADLIQGNLSRAPQLVFFGGSRSQRLDPEFARRCTGLSAANLSVSCAKPEVAWGYVNWLYHRWPDARIRWFWGMQSGMLKDRDLDPALLQDRRFYPYFPDDLLASQRERLPDSVAGMPHSYGFLRNHYSSRGLLLWNTYDKRLTKGYTLDQALDAYIRNMLHTGLTSTDTDTRARSYFEQTIKLLNAHGTTPVIVLMPIHPRVLRVMKQHHLDGEREHLRAYLATLSETLSIKVLDFTTLESFNGEAAWFYDGVHVTRRNANRVVVAAKAQAGDDLK